jgi:hypothetical protein
VAKTACELAGIDVRTLQRWKREGRNYFRDAENAARARGWQKAHPGYWRNGTRYRRRALQETLPLNLLIPQENEALTGKTQTPPASALQEALCAPGPILIGLIATLVDSPLQDDIAQTSRRLLQLGHDILSGTNSDDPKTGAAP